MPYTLVNAPYLLATSTGGLKLLPVHPSSQTSLYYIHLNKTMTFLGLANSNSVTSWKQWSNQQIWWRLERPIWLRRVRRRSSYRQDGQREQKAHGKAVVVERILPRPHGVVLKADRLVLLVLAQLLVEEEHNADGELLQPDYGADEPGCTHGPQEGEPGPESRQAGVRQSAWQKHSNPDMTHPPERMDHGQVAVQTDAAQEADADVDVFIK